MALATVNLFNTRSAILQRMFADSMLLGILVLLTLAHKKPDKSLEQKKAGSKFHLHHRI